jgi:hypothetical protein
MLVRDRGFHSRVAYSRPEQADPEPERVHQRQPGKMAPGGLAGLGLGHGLLDRLGGVAQDVDQQEHQDAGRQSVEERPAPLAGEGDPPEREAEEDGGPGDGREQDRLGGRHRSGPWRRG